MRFRAATACWACSWSSSAPTPGLGGLVGGHAAFGPGVGLDEPLLLQQAVGLLDSVGVDPQQGGNHPPGGQGIARGYGPPRDAQLYVAEDLLVNGHPVEEDQVVKGDHRNHLPFICITRVIRFLTVL